MSQSRVDEELFRYVEDYASSISSGDVSEDDKIGRSWEIFTFCQLFFDQFFGQFGTNISGFSQRSREVATLLIETLKAAGQASDSVRELVVQYEEFCDMTASMSKGYGTSTSVTARKFHDEYLERLLVAIESWAAGDGMVGLNCRVAESLARYRAAVENAQW